MFRQRKHKTFKYKSRFSKENQDIEVEDTSRDFAEKWRRENAGKGKKVKGLFSMRFLILALVLLLICMYLLEKKYM